MLRGTQDLEVLGRRLGARGGGGGIASSCLVDLEADILWEHPPWGAPSLGSTLEGAAEHGDRSPWTRRVGVGRGLSGGDAQVPEPLT